MSDQAVTFDDLMQQATHADATSPVTIPEGWGQGRATFGGLVAAMIYTAMERRVAAGRPLRSLSLSFVGPVAPGPVELQVEILREGRGVTQAEGRLLQNGAVQAVLLGSFGGVRESQVRVQAASAPHVKQPDECPELPYIPNITPEFTQKYVYGWAIGDMPFSNSKSREMGGWVKLRDDHHHITTAHVLGLVDAWPPALLPMLEGPAPASSLSWTIEFVQPMPQVRADDWFLYFAEIDHARDGFGHIQARLWSAAGELIALSRQTVTVFA